MLDCIIQCCSYNRGESFRKEFARLGEVRSLLAENVRVMALTATAKISSRRAICRVLGMSRPVIVSESPNKPNIKYSVHLKSCSIEEAFAPSVEEVEQKRMNTDKTIIFCRSYENITRIYRLFKSRLGKNKTEPPGLPDLAYFRLVDMFTACTHDDVKNSIIQSFPNQSSHLRIIIASIAFGMGLDCPNIRRIIHWAPPNDVESYLQETGRAGRDGNTASAVLYYSNLDTCREHITQEIRDYCGLKTDCRRAFLLKDFDGTACKVVGCSCCDICTLSCKCSRCS